jgi:hypothetical protein
MFEKYKKLFKNTKILLFIIVLLAAILRFYLLGSNPPALNWDEASWGYNAYSIGIDGRDEFGRFLPYDYLESFGDFKPPLNLQPDLLLHFSEPLLYLLHIFWSEIYFRKTDHLR